VKGKDQKNQLFLGLQCPITAKNRRFHSCISQTHNTNFPTSTWIAGQGVHLVRILNMWKLLSARKEREGYLKDTEKLSTGGAGSHPVANPAGGASQ
jgi:hypothetical protein